MDSFFTKILNTNETWSTTTDCSTSLSRSLNENPENTLFLPRSRNGGQN